MDITVTEHWLHIGKVNEFMPLKPHSKLNWFMLPIFNRNSPTKQQVHKFWKKPGIHCSWNNFWRFDFSHQFNDWRYNFHQTGRWFLITVCFGGNTFLSWCSFSFSLSIWSHYQEYSLSRPAVSKISMRLPTPWSEWTWSDNVYMLCTQWHMLLKILGHVHVIEIHILDIRWPVRCPHIHPYGCYVPRDVNI